jgi:hypothetical protein
MSTVCANVQVRPVLGRSECPRRPVELVQLETGSTGLLAGVCHVTRHRVRLGQPEAQLQLQVEFVAFFRMLRTALSGNMMADSDSDPA